MISFLLMNFIYDKNYFPLGRVLEEVRDDVSHGDAHDSRVRARSRCSRFLRSDEVGDERADCGQVRVIIAATPRSRSRRCARDATSLVRGRDQRRCLLQQGRIRVG